MRAVRTPAGSKPGFGCVRFVNVRSISPAPIRRTKPRATSTTTSERRVQARRPPATVRAPSASTGRRPERAAARAGARPNRRLEASAIDGGGGQHSGVQLDGLPDCQASRKNAAARLCRHSPPEHPRRPPASASTMLSVRIWRTTAARPPPSAMRVAISRRRAAPCASNRPAIFAQPMSSTAPTAAHSTFSGFRVSSVRPRCKGTSPSRACVAAGST